MKRNGREELEVAEERYVIFIDLCMQWRKLIKTFLTVAASWLHHSRVRLVGCLKLKDIKLLHMEFHSQKKQKVISHLLKLLEGTEKQSQGRLLRSLKLLLNDSCLIIFRICWSLSRKIPNLEKCEGNESSNLCFLIAVKFRLESED